MSNSFMQELKIVKCKELATKPGYYSVSIYMEPFLINGFLYLKDSDSLQMPRDFRGRAGVRMFGRQAKVLKKGIREYICIVSEHKECICTSNK